MELIFEILENGNAEMTGMRFFFSTPRWRIASIGDRSFVSGGRRNCNLLQW